MVADYDHVAILDSIVYRVDSAGLDAITYHVVLQKGHAVADDRASVFFLYSETDHRIRFATFGHPEWGTNAPHVFTVFPRIFFTISADPRVYMLAVSYGAWESMGTWVVFDATTGQPLTVPLHPLGQ